MSTIAREKLATQVNTEMLSKVRELAQREGLQIQALVDEAVADLVEKHNRAKQRAHVMAAYQGSHARFAGLYKKIAK